MFSSIRLDDDAPFLVHDHAVALEDQTAVEGPQVVHRQLLGAVLQVVYVHLSGLVAVVLDELQAKDYQNRKK